MNKTLRQLHESVLDLVGLFNQPQRDSELIKEAGIELDRALFPLLVRIDRRGPIGVGDLADNAGRDYTTVSRQVAKLERLGMVTRKSKKDDKRITEITITKKGLKLTAALDKARQRLAWPIIAGWSEKDRSNLVRLLRRFTDDAIAHVKNGQ